jgi:hypothetical protein
MKKYTFRLLLICAFILCSAAVYGMEAPKDNNVIVINKDEITDTDQLFLRAKSGISDCDVKPFLEDQNLILKSQDGDTRKLQSYSTAQVLKKIKKQDGSTEQTIALTTFIEIDNSDLGIVPMANENNYKEDWDDTYAVRAYSTRYITSNTIGLNTSYLLTKVTGGWENQSFQVSLSERNVDYRCVGVLPDGIGDLTQRVNKAPTGNTFSYNTGFKKYVYNGMGIGFSVGVITKAKLTRGTANWYLTLDNTIS